MRRILLPLLLSVSLPAMAQTFPDRKGLAVVDAANVIPDDQEKALNELIVTWVKNTGHQFVVATIPDLQGYDVADYGYKLGRAWGLGRKESDDGVILILAPNSRKLRIEVGYGLEPILTDATTSDILRTAIVPDMKAGNIPSALSKGAITIMSTVDRGDSAQAAAKAQPKTVINNTKSTGSGAGWLIAGLLGIFGLGGTGTAVFLARRRARYAREAEERMAQRRRDREDQLAREVRETREKAPEPRPRRTAMRPEMGMPYGTQSGREPSRAPKVTQPPKRSRYDDPPYSPPAPSYVPPAPSYEPPAPSYVPPAPSYEPPSYSPPPPPPPSWDPPSPPPPSPSFDSGGGSFGGGGSSTDY